VPKAVTVWAVKLGRGPLTERKGSLSLGAGELAFEAEDGLSHVRFSLAELRAARRVRGSPVLLVSHMSGERIERIAFYFVQPPPLEPEPEAATDHLDVLSAARRTRRGTRRRNASYLGMWNREKKAEVLEWTEAIRSAMQTAEG
jgi:hypothetical protein